MAMYKIPQDVEADDKFVGPLSFKQFIFVGIALASCYLGFLAIMRGFWPALLFLMPIILVFGFLGYPWGRDQPTEVWLAARIRFMIKPRIRIWNQSGMSELVQINVPKHIERTYSDGLSQIEVKSRLSGLADLLDSRGWAVRNVGAGQADVFTSNIVVGGSQDPDDNRLMMIAPVQVINEDTTATDILDESNSPTAQHFADMIKASEDKHRQDLLAQLEHSRQTVQQPATTTQSPDSNSFWSMLQKKPPQPTAEPATTNAPTTPATALAPPASSAFAPPQPTPTYSAPSPVTFAPQQQAADYSGGVVGEESGLAARLSTQDEEALLNRIHNAPHINAYGHMKTLQPLDEPAMGGAQPQTSPQTQPQPAQQLTPQQPVTPPVDPAIINLANNDDLSVETIQRQAHKKDEPKSDGEVVISLR